VDAFEALLSAGHKAQGAEVADFYSQAIALYQGEYLNNLLYYDWPIPERQRLSSASLMAMRRLAGHHMAQGNHEEAIDLIKRALKIDGLNEESHREAMRYYAAAGDEVGLARQYQQLQQALRDELNIDPSSQTQALYQRLVAEAGLTQR
jgi:LuxR family maltose regulon positive regulatory protein